MPRNIASGFTALALMAAFTTALFFTGYTSLLYAPVVLGLLVVAGLLLFPALLKNALSFPAGAVPLLLFGFWLYATFSLMGSTIPFASMVTWLIFSAAPLLFFCLLAGPDRNTVLKAAVFGLMMALSVLAGWTVIDYLFLGGGMAGRAHAPLPNPNTLAGLMNLGLFPALALFLSARNHDIPKLALALLFFAALLATESRGGILSALIAGGVLLFALRPVLCRKKLLSLLIATALIFGAFQFAGQSAERLTGLAAPGQQKEIVARMAIWQSTVAMIKDHPFKGTGLGTFYQTYPAYRAPDTDNSSGHWAHNDPLQFWAEMGAAAPLLFYALLIGILWQTIRALRALPRDSELRAPIMGIFAALLALGLHTHVSFHLYILAILIICGVWLAAWYALTAAALEEPSFKPALLSRRQRIIAPLGLLAVFMVCGWMAVSSALGMHYLLAAKTAIRVGDIGSFTTAIDKARRYGPASFIDPDVHLAGLYIDLQVAPGVLFTENEQADMAAQAHVLLDRAQRLNPHWAEIDHKRAKLYMATNEPDKALASWETAVKKNPQHYKARRELAALYMQRGMPLKAYQVLEAGLHYPHNQTVDAAFKTLMKEIEPLARLQRQYQP
ncbi:MAG: O-antigen ligase family protein [Rhodospirillales bacterium]|nr:O-antigen ligase family protein [Rhodospirillales bacterium]